MPGNSNQQSMTPNNLNHQIMSQSNLIQQKTKQSIFNNYRDISNQIQKYQKEKMVNNIDRIKKMGENKTNNSGSKSKKNIQITPNQQNSCFINEKQELQKKQSKERLMIYNDSHQSPVYKMNLQKKIDSHFNMNKNFKTQKLKTETSPIGHKKNINVTTLNQKIEEFKNHFSKKSYLDRNKENLDNSNSFKTPQNFLMNKTQFNQQNLSLKKQFQNSSKQDLSFNQFL